MRHDCGGLSPSLIHRGIVLDSADSNPIRWKRSDPSCQPCRLCSACDGRFPSVQFWTWSQRFLVGSWSESSFERLSIMSKSILFALLSVAGPCLSTGQAFACGRGACCTTACAPSCAAPATGAPADPHAGMQMPQANRGAAYQSFSYEPGTAAPMMSAPYRSTRQSSSFYDSVRGDRKIRGQY